MKNRKKRQTKLLTALFMLSLSLSLLLGIGLPAVASGQQETEVGYDLVYNTNGTFAGVNLTDSIMGGLSAELSHNMTATDDATAYGTVAINLNQEQQFSRANTTGFALKFKAYNPSVAVKKLFLFIKDTDGNLFRLYTGTATDYVFINEDGVISSLKNSTGFDIPRESDVHGTLYFEWGKGQVIAITSGATLGTVQTIYVGMDMRLVRDAGSAVTIGSVAAVDARDTQNISVKKLLNTADLTYSDNPQDTDADVNLADITKGKTINSTVVVSNGAVFQSEASSQTAVNNWKFYRYGGENIADSLNGAFEMKLKSDYTANGSLGVVTIAFDTTIDPSDSAGFMLKLSTPKSVSARIFFESSDNALFRVFNAQAAVRSDTFIGDDGTVNKISSQNSFVNFKEGWQGSWYLPWGSLIATPTTGPIPKNATFTKMHIVLDNRAGNAHISVDRPIIIGAMYTANGDADMTTTKVFNTAEFSYSADIADDTADVNLIDITKGTKIYSKHSITSVNVMQDGTVADTQTTIDNWSYMRKPYALTVNYVDEYDEEIRNATVYDSEFSAETGLFSYDITAPTVNGYEFDSEVDDKPLSGDITQNTTLTLVYIESAAPADPTMDYDIIYDGNDEFAGVNIKNTLNGALEATVRDDLVFTTDSQGAVTIEFDAIDTSQSLGFLLTLYSGSNNIVRVNFEDESGNTYRVVSANAREDIFVSPNGNIGELALSGFNVSLQKDMVGTWHCEWENLTKNSGGGAIPVGTKLVKMHISIEMRIKNYADSPVAIGTLATIDISPRGNITVTKIFNTAEFTYTTDAEEETADVNLADVTKGIKAYSAHSMSKNFILDEVPADTTISVGNWSYRRYSDIKITVNHIDENGKTLKLSDTIPLEFGSAQYTVTPAEILGYVYSSADKDLSGTASESFTVNVVYAPQIFQITINFVDENNEEIADSKTIDVAYKQLYEIEPDAIEGYTFKEASVTSLTLQIMGDRTITLTYSKDKSDIGCKSSFIGVGAIFALFAAIVVIKKRGNKEI